METKKKLSATVIKQSGQDKNSRDITFVLSDETPDSDGDIIRVSGWDTARFQSNPVCMGFHEYDEFPYGEWRNVYKDLRSSPPRLVGTLHFPTIEELCPSGEVSEHAKNVDMACAMVNAGYLNAVSVGCYYKEAERRQDYPDGTPEWMRGYDVTKAELLEVSLVPIPANPHALAQLSADKNIDKKMVEFIQKSFKENNVTKAAIPFKHYALAEEDTKWDGPKVVADSEIADLKVICTWYDSSKDEADLTKGDFKLPHHLTKADGYKTVKAGVVAAAGAMLGARGGVKIPEADVEKVKFHLKSHYKEFELDWPEDKSAWVEQCKSLGFDSLIEDKAIVAQKDGRRLSADTLSKIDDLEACVKELDDAIKACTSSKDNLMKRIKALRDGVNPDEPEEPDNQGEPNGMEPDGSKASKSFTIKIVSGRNAGK